MDERLRLWESYSRPGLADCSPRAGSAAGESARSSSRPPEKSVIRRLLGVVAGIAPSTSCSFLAQRRSEYALAAGTLVLKLLASATRCPGDDRTGPDAAGLSVAALT